MAAKLTVAELSERVDKLSADVYAKLDSEVKKLTDNYDMHFNHLDDCNNRSRLNEEKLVNRLKETSKYKNLAIAASAVAAISLVLSIISIVQLYAK